MKFPIERTGERPLEWHHIAENRNEPAPFLLGGQEVPISLSRKSMAGRRDCWRECQARPHKHDNASTHANTPRCCATLIMSP